MALGIGVGVQDFLTTLLSPMPVWHHYAESPRTSDVSFSTHYFCFSFFYFIPLNKQYSFLILSMALQPQMPTQFQQLPHSCDTVFFISEKEIYQDNGGVSAWARARVCVKAQEFPTPFTLLLVPQFLNQVPTSF